jgi:hypothetical protein
MSKSFLAIITTIAAGFLAVFYLAMVSMGTAYDFISNTGLLLCGLAVVSGWMRVWNNSRVVMFVWWASLAIALIMIVVVEFAQHL